MSDEYLNLAKQNSQKIAGSSTAPRLSNPINNDEELVRRAQQDDPWAIEQLVLRYQKKVYAIAYQMLSGDAEEAKDRTQDAFLQVFRNIKKFKGNASFYTWLYRIVVNTCIDALRRRRRWQKIFFPWHSGKNKDETSSTSLEELPDTDKRLDPLAIVQHRQLEIDVKRILKTLTEKQRIIFQLKVFQEMRISEIANIMGLAQGTVKSHLFRATRIIQKQLKGWAEY